MSDCIPGEAGVTGRARNRRDAGKRNGAEGRVAIVRAVLSLTLPALLAASGVSARAQGDKALGNICRPSA